LQRHELGFQRGGRLWGAAGVVADHGLVRGPVFKREEQNAVRAAAVSPRSAGFLVVVGQRLWHGEVDDVAHVWLVDAHAESQRGADELDFAF
jgi:hypothetical protein